MTYNIKYSIDDILLKKDCDDHQCKGCFLLIYQKTPLQCREGHWRCKGCWESLLQNKEIIKCPVNDCHCTIKSITDLSKCTVIEAGFNKKKVYCPNLFYYNDEDSDEEESETPNANANANAMLRKDELFGCKDVIRVDGITPHLKSCQYRFIQCTNNGCEEIIRFNGLDIHLDTCEWITCRLCTRGILKSNLQNHTTQCEKTTTPCTHCETTIERVNLQSHIELDCSQTEIPCKLKSEGCQSIIKRSELSTHLQHPSHLELLIHAYEKQSIENRDLNLQLVNQGKEISNQSLKINNQSLEIKNLESTIIVIEQRMDIDRKSLKIENLSQTVETLSQRVEELSQSFEKLTSTSNQKFGEMYEKLSSINMVPEYPHRYRNKWEILNFPIFGSNRDLKSSMFSHGSLTFSFEIPKFGIGDSVSIYFCTFCSFKPFTIDMTYCLKDNSEKTVSTDIKYNSKFNQFYVGSVGPADSLLIANDILIFRFSISE